MLRFVKNYRRTIGADAAEDDDYEEPELPKQHSTTQRKKSKPMSAQEQESKIALVRQQLQQFQNQSGSDQGNDGKQGQVSFTSNQNMSTVVASPFRTFQGSRRMGQGRSASVYQPLERRFAKSFVTDVSTGNILQS